MTSFVPPKFADLGKASSELLKKKFDDKKDFNYNVVVKGKTASGLVFTSEGAFNTKKNNDLSVTLKANYKPQWGEAEATLQTSGPSKAEFKFKKLTKGLTFTVTADTAPVFAAPSKDPKKPNKFKDLAVKLAAEYSQDFFTGSASVETAFGESTLLGGSGVIGFDGLSVGGSVQLDTKSISSVDDYNVGAQYAAADYTVTAKTANQGNDLDLSYLHKVDKDVTVCGVLGAKLDGSAERSFALATEYKVDANTTVKFRGNTNRTIAVAVEQRLANPRVQVGVASSWGIVGFSAPNPKDFGFTLTFGDYDA